MVMSNSRTVQIRTLHFHLWEFIKFNPRNYIVFESPSILIAMSQFCINLFVNKEWLCQTFWPSRLGPSTFICESSSSSPQEITCIRMPFNFDSDESISYVRKQGMVMSNSCIDQSFGINQIWCFKSFDREIKLWSLTQALSLPTTFFITS